MDDDKVAAIANALEALHMNQTALRAGLEEVRHGSGSEAL